MAKRIRRAIVNTKAGCILNEWLAGSFSGPLDGLDVASGFTARAGEIAGEIGRLTGKFVSSSS